MLFSFLLMLLLGWLQDIVRKDRNQFVGSLNVAAFGVAKIQLLLPAGIRTWCAKPMYFIACW
jgi:hypothetical protein